MAIYPTIHVISIASYLAYYRPNRQTFHIASLTPRLILDANLTSNQANPCGQF